MAIITKQELKTFSANLTSSTRAAYFTKTFSLNEAKSRSIRTVFLSHSHSDKDVIEPAIALLKSVGVNVYVDWKDSSMPAITNAVTAEKIKDNIRKHDRFILLASPAAIKSNWVNWELGFGDAHKYLPNIALLPVVETTDDWKDAEYLRIYPYIERVASYQGYQFVYNYFVVNPDGTKIELKTWLTR
jgi:TIR domain-containing protein